MLLALRRGLWLTAGLFCLLAALTRITGLAATATLGLAALYALWRIWRRHRRQLPADENGPMWDRPVAWWRPIAATLIGAVGVPAFIVWIGLRVGLLDAYFLI